MSTSIIQVTRPVSRTPAQTPEKVSKPREPAEPSSLTAEYLRSILTYDPATGIFTWKVRAANRIHIGDVAGSQSGDGYLEVKVQSHIYKAHRLAWLYMHGVWPTDQIDHVNRVRADNRISNLREVSHKQNHQNRSKPSHNTSGHPGVSWAKREGKWIARITHNYKHIYLGQFTNIEDAIAARKAAEKLYWADTQ